MKNICLLLSALVALISLGLAVYSIHQAVIYKLTTAQIVVICTGMVSVVLITFKIMFEIAYNLYKDKD